jgi:chemotaxis protein histidine kinase CheA
MLTDRAGTTEFYRETESLLADLLGGNVDDETARRTIHTIKGNAALFGLETLARACHAVEDRIGERGRVVEQDAHAINAAWTRATTRLGAALVGMTQSVEVARDDIEALACGLRQRRPHDELRAWVDRWSDERVAKRLHRFGEYAELLAQRLGKAPLRVIVDAADVRLPAQSWAPFWVAFQHLIRNAVDHGVASAEERARAGKHESATLKLTCALTGTDMCIAVEDDGAGIDWPAIARRAHALGRPAASQCDLEEALFGHGLTTKETVTATSGRGVGLAALRHACGMSGGRVIVTSTAGQGTRFEVRWPSHTKRHAQPSTSGTDNQRKSA